MSRGDAGAELPEAPGIRRELSLQLGRLPGTAAVPTQLNGADPAGAREGDAGKMDRSSRQGGTIHGPFGAGHGLDDSALVPAVVLPVTRLIARREPDVRDPLRLLHPVSARKDEARGEAMHRRQRRTVEMGGEQVV